MTRVYENIKTLAFSRGFTHVFFLPPAVLADWPEKAARASLSLTLKSDIPAAFPFASAVLTLGRAYSPYPASSHISAYYIQSNLTYHAARALAQDISGSLGIRAQHSPLIPVRALLLNEGIGVMGKNGLLRLRDSGARIVFETLVLSGPAPDVQPESAPPCPEGCRACINACPMGAITANGLTQQKCLRYLKLHGAYMDERVLRAQSVFLGCEECMRACPFDPPAVPVPESEATAFELSRLIRGDATDARRLCGKNITGGGALTADAIVFAARAGLLSTEISDALSSPFERVREAARWALEFFFT